MRLRLRADGFTHAVKKRNIPTAGTSGPDCCSVRSMKARSHSCDVTVAARGYIAIPIPPWASVVCPLADANGYMLASLRDGTKLVPANAGRGRPLLRRCGLNHKKPCGHAPTRWLTPGTQKSTCMPCNSGCLPELDTLRPSPQSSNNHCCTSTYQGAAGMGNDGNMENQGGFYLIFERRLLSEFARQNSG